MPIWHTGELLSEHRYAPTIISYQSSYDHDMIIAKEIYLTSRLSKEPFFMRIDLSRPIDAKALDHINPNNGMILWHSERYHDGNDNLKEEVMAQHIYWLHQLYDRGFTYIVLAADEDGFIHQSLSPRYSAQDLFRRMSFLVNLYVKLRAINKNIMVLLPIEDLAPGGLDPSDGLAITNNLYDLGLREIITTSGTRQFMPLYKRQITKEKIGSPHYLCHEPYLASSLWLKNIPHLSLWCLAFFHNDNEAVLLAEKLGLTGLIKKAIA